MAHDNCHNCSHVTTSTRQTLDELDFERGIWSAVIYKDTDALEKHIRNGRVHDRDNSGYTGNWHTFVRHFYLN